MEHKKNRELSLNFFNRHQETGQLPLSIHVLIEFLRLHPSNPFICPVMVIRHGRAEINLKLGKRETYKKTGRMDK